MAGYIGRRRDAAAARECRYQPALQTREEAQLWPLVSSEEGDLLVLTKVTQSQVEGGTMEVDEATHKETASPLLMRCTSLHLLNSAFGA